MDQKEERLVLSVSEGQAVEKPDWLAREWPLTIVVNGRRCTTLFATPADLEELAVGYAYNNGLLASKSDIRALALDAGGRQAVLELAPASAGEESLRRQGPGGFRLSSSRITGLMAEFSTASALFRETGAVHAAALAGDKILVFREDVARHNAIDKLAGNIVLEDRDPSRLCLLISGRISAAVVTKCRRMGIGLVISRAAPTSLAVAMAEEAGLTLVGFARGQRFNIYCNPWRVEL
ncbi:MAG TPA: formate dehydrogenase accessory sulfurtransferase FdhD [Bacillota bacterium]|nr:formate dehydrogenase accessory sulfurtransferase FdhD [Bacillota bacterium]HPZ90900.1 formate dehydrogenase accessory sulfurtransferase FdhD [Bacillota bacterium]HQE02128.1 formate dehydrogenase accessory sulfurtransferase FdhD [Bacillota bacterium]